MDNNKTNKVEVYKGFLYISIGCIGAIGMLVAYILVCLITSNFKLDYLTAGELCNLLLVGLVEDIIFGMIFYNIFGKLAIKAKQKPLTNEKKKRIIQKQIIINIVLYMIFFITTLISIYKDLYEGIVFSIGFILAITLWQIGCIIARNLLNKDVSQINKRLQDTKNK